MQAAQEAQGWDLAALRRRDRKRRARRAQKDKQQARKCLQALRDGKTVSKYKHVVDCKRARQWLHAQLLRADRGGINEETRKQLTAFWRRGEYADQMTRTVNKEGGEEEEVPALSEDAVAAWRRFEGGEEEALGEAEDQNGDEREEEGVGLDDRRSLGEKGADEVKHGFWGQPEPVAADE